MKWLMCAQSRLKTAAFIDAIRADGECHESSLSIADVLSLCCNLVVLDGEQDVFRFAHLSVREYLEGRTEYSLLSSHRLALERCLKVVTSEIKEHLDRNMSNLVDFSHENMATQNITSPTCSAESNKEFRSSSGFGSYAFVNWPLHYQAVGAKPLPENLWEQLRALLFQGRKTNRLYTTWAVTGSKIYGWKEYSIDSTFYTWILRNLPSTPPTPLFLACFFGLVSLIKDLESRPNIDWNQKNSSGFTALGLAAQYKHLAVVRMLLKNGAGVNAMSRYGTALHLTSSRGHNDIVRHLLHWRADLEAKNHMETQVCGLLRIMGEWRHCSYSLKMEPKSMLRAMTALCCTLRQEMDI